MSEQKCIIVHGCPSTSLDASYNQHWIPWTKNTLEQHGIKTHTPMMPSPWEPSYEKFKKEFEKNKIDSNTILIGHSCGCAFLIRWLGDSNHKIEKLILVAPWKINDEGDVFREHFYSFEINPEIKKRVKKIIYFTANNEEDAGKKSLKMYHDILGGEIVTIPNYGHFTLNEMKTEKFPELISKAIE